MKSSNRYLAKNSFSRLLTFSALYFAQGIPQGITFAAILAWLAGTSFGETIENSLREASKTFQKQNTISSDDILFFQIQK